jgi:hypothetical protein
MSRVWKIAGIAMLVVILGVAAVGVVAFAQEGEDGPNWPFDFSARFREAISDILGITVEEYDEAVDQAQGQVLDEALAEDWLTEEQAERIQERMGQGFAPGMRGGFPGLHGGKFVPRGLVGGPEDSLIAVAADELDMTTADLVTELRDGKSIADVAAEKGVDTQAIADSYLDKLSENLAAAVEDGRITQNQADWMLEQAGERVDDQLNRTWEGCGPRGFPGGGRPGRMLDSSGLGDA